MRVAVISDWYLPRLGGIELYLAELVQKLVSDGVDLEVLTPVPGLEAINGVSIRRLCDNEAPNGGYRFPPSRHASNGPDFLYLLELFFGSQRPRPLRRLKFALLTGGYDVVHIHLGNTPFSYLAVNLCRDLGLPVLATFHSVLGSSERRVAAIAGRLLHTADWPATVKLTSVSRFAAAARTPLFGAAPLDVMPNGVDTDLWQAVRAHRAKRRAEAGRSPRIELFAAMRLHSRKRPMQLLDAMVELQRIQPGTSVRLRIAGDGPLRGRLERRIAMFGLTGIVETYGQLGRSNIAAMMAETDLFLMPSRLESFGIAALEARISGVPVLAFRESGMRDFLQPDADSLLVSNDAGFAAALARFCADPALRAQLDSGAALPLAGYGWNDLVRNCRAAYAEALVMR